MGQVQKNFLMFILRYRQVINEPQFIIQKVCMILRKARGANFPFQCETRNTNQEIIAITDRCLKRSLKKTSLYPQASWLVSC